MKSKRNWACKVYEIIISKKATKQLDKLEKTIKIRIISTLQRIRIRPEKHLKKLVGDPSYRLRVGNYRILIDVNKNRLELLVIEVGHRKNIYKK